MTSTLTLTPNKEVLNQTWFTRQRRERRMMKSTAQTHEWMKCSEGIKHGYIPSWALKQDSIMNVLLPKRVYMDKNGQEKVRENIVPTWSTKGRYQESKDQQDKPACFSNITDPSILSNLPHVNEENLYTLYQQLIHCDSKYHQELIYEDTVTTDTLAAIIFLNETGEIDKVQDYFICSCRNSYPKIYDSPIPCINTKTGEEVNFLLPPGVKSSCLFKYFCLFVPPHMKLTIV